MTTSPTWQDVTLPGEATDFFLRTSMQPFDLAADSYSPVNARWLMELSRLSYRHDAEETDNPPQPTRTEFLAQAGFRQIKFFQFKALDVDTQAMLVASTQRDYAVLVFRGTEPFGITDLVTDIEARKNPVKRWKRAVKRLKNADPLASGEKALVHTGFKKALDGVWHEIEKELDKLKCPVYFTGHSLGAALATLAAARTLPGCNLRAVYTFASPRVGNQAFADSMAQLPIYRVVNGSDGVAALPPEMLGFAHVGQEQLLDSPSSFLSWLTPGRWFLFKSLSDHAPIGYVDHIK